MEGSKIKRAKTCKWREGLKKKKKKVTTLKANPTINEDNT